MPSETTDRRRAPRVACDLPLLVHSAGRSLRARIVDLSRVGALARIPLAELGLPEDIPLAALGREATFLLGERVRLDLHYEVLGTLVQRRARPVRLGRADEADGIVEVGLDLVVPLDDLEVEFLGVPLPPVRNGSPASWIPEGARRAEAPPVSIVLCSDGGAGAPPLRIVPTWLDGAGARADLGPVKGLPVLPEHGGAAGVLAMLAEAYGEPRLVLLAGGEPIWSGTARFAAVEVCPRRDDVSVQLRFPDRLEPRIRARLGC